MGVREEALKLGAVQFRKYERLHRAKGTEDGNQKAETNRQMAETLEAALKADAEGLPVAGYRPQNPLAIDCVNAMKAREELILQQLDHMSVDPEVEQRWLALGRTHIELGFMAINRSIFQPGRVKLGQDKPEVIEVELADPPAATITQILRTGDSPTVVAEWSDGYENSLDLRNYPHETEDTIRARLQNLRVKGHP